MSLIYIKDNDGKVETIVTLSGYYQYKGFTFTFHTYLGPTKLNKDLEISKCQGREFWKAFEEWLNLTKEEREATRI